MSLMDGHSMRLSHRPESMFLAAARHRKAKHSISTTSRPNDVWEMSHQSIRFPAALRQLDSKSPTKTVGSGSRVNTMGAVAIAEGCNVNGKDPSNEQPPR